MKILKLAALALLGLFATINAMAEERTEGFEDVTITNADTWGQGTELSNGWIIVGGKIATSKDATNYGFWTTSYAGSKSLTAQYSSSNSGIVVIPQQLSGSFTFYARKSSTSSSTKGYVYVYEMEEDGDSFTKGATLLNSPTLTTTWTQYTVELGEDPHYIGINMIRAGIDEIVYNTYEAPAGPRLQVLQDDKTVKSGAAYNFGLVAEDAAVTYTIKNAGTETMNATIECTGDYTVSTANVSLAADETADITITQSAATAGNKAGTLTISPEGLDAFTLNLSGIVRDPAKLYVDFSEAPANWTLGGWSVNAGGYATIGYNYYYSNASLSSNKALQTSLLSVEESEPLFIRYRKNYNSSYTNGTLCFWASADGANWTKVGDNVTATEYNVWEETTVSGFPTSAKYVAISGQYVDIDDFYGFALSADPVMTIANETVTDNAIVQNFGKCKADAVKTYTVRNIGAGPLHVGLANSNTTDFTISETSLDVAAGESTTFDLTFNYSTVYGTKNTTVTLTPNAGDVITINVTAAAQDPEEFTEDFEEGIPASWTNNGWTIENAPTYGNGTKMVYAGYQNGKTLVSPRLQAKTGDVIDIEALQPWNDEPLTLEYSLDDGDSWTQGFSEVPAANNTLHTLHFTAPADGIYLLRFSGRYNYIDNICGFKLAQIPVMAVTTTAGATCEGNVFTDDFGRLSANASHTYTVANTGAGTLTVSIASDAADFTVSEATLEVGAGESKTFDLTFEHSSSYGEKTATVTITPANSGLAAVTIHASAVSLDPEAFFVDFEEGIPAAMANTGWTVQSQNGSKMAFSYNSDDHRLTTPLLVAGEGETLTFDAYQLWNDEPLKLEYSLDFGHTWETAFEEAPAEDNTARQFTFTAPQDGKYLVRFSGSYNYLDNIYGFKVTEVAELSLVAEDEERYYATFSNAEDVTFAPDVTVNAVTIVDGVLVVTEVENGFVPANTGVLITAPKTAARYARVSGVSAVPADNMLVAAAEAMTGDKLFYKLAYDDYETKTGLGFYWGAADGGAFDAKEDGAYLAVPKSAASAKGFRFDGGEITVIAASAIGQDSDIIYSLQGQRVAAAKAGVYVKNGKKVVIR